MILHSLRLENFGLYGGVNQFDLRSDPADDRPVILVKGHNGGGKTTFLEAVRLALYGKRALGHRVSRSDYERYLVQKIYALASVRKASVSLVFARREEGIEYLYEVTRAWAARGASVIDTIELKRDGEEVDDIPREEWDFYLEDLIPPGVSQLFFFDGEKIQDIADGEATDGLRDAIRSLLGLDLIEQLRNDLAVYTARTSEDTGDVDFDSLQRNIMALRDELVFKEEEAAELTSVRDQAARRIDRAQKTFQSEGGRAALDRDALQRAQTSCEKRIESLQTDLKRLANGPLPLGLASTLIEKLQQAVTGQETQAGRQAVEAFLSAFETAKLEKPTERPAWTKGHFSAMRRFLANQETKTSITLDAEPDWISERLGLLSSGLHLEAISVADRLDEALFERDRLKLQLKSLDSTAATEALEALKSAEYELGSVETKLRTVAAVVESLRFQITGLEKQKHRALDAQLQRQHQERRLELATRAQRALLDYETQILEHRLAALSSHFVECFNGLIRKKYLVSTAEVDRESFAISLLGEDGVHISKESLSAGERQIFAISMLWALGKTSGRELPIIIDTPLSRLDRRHREAIITRYVPECSHQVILLCTDTELTADLETIIDPHVARRFELGVPEGARRTEIRPADEIAERAIVHAH